MAAPSPAPDPLTSRDPGILNARPLELFFDLVFVFAVSQFTKLVAHPHGWTDYLQAGLAFLSVAWMYDAFIWLTSNLHLEEDGDDHENWLVFSGMLLFFGMAVGIPQLSQGGGGLFAFSLLGTVLLHIFSFRRADAGSVLAINQVAPYNLLTALLVVFALFSPVPWRWVLWVLAVIVHYLPLLRGDFSLFPFSFSPRHFAERHGLILIIALGESVIALGAGATGMKFSGGLLAYVLLGLFLLASLWWTYFGMTQRFAEHRLVQAAPASRVQLAGSYGMVHFPLLAGCILVAAALEVGVYHPLHAAAAATAWNLAGGLALFLFSLSLLRRQVALASHPPFLIGALLCLLTVPLGTHFGAVWQLLSALIIVTAVGYFDTPEQQNASH